MTAVPAQIDSHAQPAARRTAGRAEHRDGNDFSLALGARHDEKRATAKAGADDAASHGTTGSDEKTAAQAETTQAVDPAGSETAAAASAENRPQGLAAILAAVEAASRGSAAKAGTTAQAGDGGAADMAGLVERLAGRSAGTSDPARAAVGDNPFARLPAGTDEARTDLFKRLEATAAAIVDADGAPLRFAASGNAAADGQIRADFVSMRTDFAPAGHGGAAMAGGVPGARMHALGRAFGAQTEPGASDMSGAGSGSRAEADAGADGLLPNGKTGSASSAAGFAGEAGAPTRADARAGSRRDGDDGDAAATRLPVAKAEASGASPEPTGFAAIPAAGANLDVPLGRQVASALGGAFSELRSDLNGSDTAGNLRLRAGGAALKTIQIQLQPAHFGKLDVTLKLVDGHLAVQLLASEPETVMRLRDDTEGLKSLLSQSGFTVDDAAISIALRDPSQPRGGSLPGVHDNAAGFGSDDGRAASDGAARDGAGGQRGPSGQNGRDGEGTRGMTPSDAQKTHRDLGSAVYL